MKTCLKKLHKYNDELKRCPECRKISRKADRDRHPERRKMYYLKNKEREKEIHKLWMLKNPGEKEKITKDWFNKNQDYAKNRRKNDIQYRLATTLRARLQSALKNNQKKGSAIKDLGCSIDELKLYLESLFLKDMSWNNYGFGKNKWSIDHIIPLTCVDLTNREEFLKVNNYKNLRPLWNKDQLKTYWNEQRKK